jgi:hypothetical protein
MEIVECRLVSISVSATVPAAFGLPVTKVATMKVSRLPVIRQPAAFGDRARVTFGRADQVSYRRADVRQPTIFRLKNLVDHAHLDRVPGFGIDQNEAASLLVVGITVDRNATVELENTPANAVD